MLTACVMPIHADGVKWLEKCLDANKITLTQGKNDVTPTIDADNKTVTISDAVAAEYKLALTPSEKVKQTNAQTYIVLESNVKIDGTKKLNQLATDNGNFENKGNGLLGFTVQLSNKRYLTVYSIIDNRGNATTDASLKLRSFLFSNDEYKASKMEVYLKPAAAGDVVLYNVGFYTLGDILSEYNELADDGWYFTKSQYCELKSKSGNTNLNIEKAEAETTLEYNYLRAKGLGKLPDAIKQVDLRNMKLADTETTPLAKDAFADLNVSKILMSDAQYKLFPTTNTKVCAAGYHHYAYKDGVAPAEVADAVDGGGSKGKLYDYTRNFKAGNNSCVLPFDVNVEDLPSGLTAYEFESYANDVVNFKEATGVISAGTPIMVKAEEAGLYMISAASTPNLLSDISGYKDKEDTDGNKFVGSFSKEVPSSYTNRFALDSEATSFKKMSDEVKATYYRAFLSLKDEISEASVLSMSFGGGTTGISHVANSTVENGAYYNLQGVKVNPNNLPHGIYIHNGKKVIK